MIADLSQVETTERTPEAAASPVTQCDMMEDCMSATQVDLHPSTRDMGTQYEESDVLWHSTPLSSPVSSLEPLDDQESYDPFDESEPVY
uniref:Uncharacterized protein n=1 Tax=Nothobranchius furzeri TaxID=105023 RepID=A0A1A8A436_NOTFU